MRSRVRFLAILQFNISLWYYYLRTSLETQNWFAPLIQSQDSQIEENCFVVRLFANTSWNAKLIYAINKQWVTPLIQNHDSQIMKNCLVLRLYLECFWKTKEINATDIASWLSNHKELSSGAAIYGKLLIHESFTPLIWKQWVTPLIQWLRHNGELSCGATICEHLLKAEKDLRHWHENSE